MHKGIFLADQPTHPQIAQWTFFLLDLLLRRLLRTVYQLAIDHSHSFFLKQLWTASPLEGPWSWCKGAGCWMHIPFPPLAYFVAGHLLSIIISACVLRLLLMLKRIFPWNVSLTHAQGKLMFNGNFIQSTVLFNIHVIWAHMNMKYMAGHGTLSLIFIKQLLRFRTI